MSLADLSKISEDLTARSVADTVVVHSSGLHLLLAPTEIRDTEFITPEAVRRILAQLRTLYHLVIVDAGSAITTTQAAAVESADVTLQIVTADVPALRAARRQVVAWESLGVAGADSVRVVVNRFVRQSEIQQDTIDMLTLGERSEVLIPDLGRALERAGNSRTPAEARNGTWWKSLRAIGQELDSGRTYREAVAAAARQSLNGSHTEQESRTNGHSPPVGAKSRRFSRDAGQVVLGERRDGADRAGGAGGVSAVRPARHVLRMVGSGSQRCCACRVSWERIRMPLLGTSCRPACSRR